MYPLYLFFRDSTSENVICGIEYNVRGPTFVGETKQLLGTRMNGYMYNTNNPHYKVMANHFSLPDHCIVFI
jgi:hypothetical protein